MNIDESSTLNIFHRSPDGKHYFMSTSTENLPAPIFGVSDSYPTKRHNKLYDVKLCTHKFVYKGMQQLRRNDEAPTTIYICENCGFRKSQ